MFQLFEDLFVLALHQAADVIFGELSVVLEPFGRQDAALEEEVGEQVRIRRPGILRLDMEDPPAVAHVVVVPEEWAPILLAHEKTEYSPSSDCAKIALW